MSDVDAVLPYSPLLTDEEIEQITRFQRALRDVGVGAKLTIVAMGTYQVECLEHVRDILSTLVRDVVKVAPDRMYDSGPSLGLLVEFITLNFDDEFFPEDFLPTGETVEKCIEGFWDLKRYESQGQVQDA